MHTYVIIDFYHELEGIYFYSLPNSAPMKYLVVQSKKIFQAIHGICLKHHNFIWPIPLGGILTSTVYFYYEYTNTNKLYEIKVWSMSD